MDQKTASLKENVRALPRGAWLLFFGTFLNKFGAFVLPFLAIYMARLGYSASQAGLAIGAFGIGTFCASLLGGYLADNFGRRKTIMLSMFSVSFTMLALSQARSFGMIVLLAGLVGLTGELYRPASSALLADLVPSGQRLTAFAVYRIAINAGFTFGPAMAGLLAKQSFLLLFVGDAATSFLFGLVALIALPSGLRGTRTENSLLETVRIVRSDRRLRQILCASMVIGLVFLQILSSMSMEVTRAGFSPSTYGLLISLNGLLVVICELPMTTLTKRFPARRMIALGFLLIGIGFASNALVRTIPLLVLTMVLFTLGEIISMPVAAAYVADLAPAEKRGLYMGTYGLVWSLAFILGPSLGMLLFSVSPLALWITCGLFGLGSAMIILAAPKGALTASPQTELEPKLVRTR